MTGSHVALTKHGMVPAIQAIQAIQALSLLP